MFAVFRLGNCGTGLGGILSDGCGEFIPPAEQVLGEGRDRFDVVLLGDAGLGLCRAIGTEADLVAC